MPQKFIYSKVEKRIQGLQFIAADAKEFLSISNPSSYESAILDGYKFSFAKLIFPEIKFASFQSEMEIL